MSRTKPHRRSINAFHALAILCSTEAKVSNKPYAKQRQAKNVGKRRKVKSLMPATPFARRKRKIPDSVLRHNKIAMQTSLANLINKPPKHFAIADQKPLPILKSISIQSGKILNLPVIHKVVFNLTLSSFSNRLKFPLALLLFTFGQAACVSIEVEVPGPLMSAPELSSKKGDTQFTFGTEQSTRYTFTDDASRRPLDLTTSSSSRAGGYLFGNAGYSVTEWFQLSLGLIPTSLGTPLNVGTQILGHLQVIGHGTEAGAKLAIFGGYLSTSVSTGGNQNGTFGPGGHDWRARMGAVANDRWFGRLPVFCWTAFLYCRWIRRSNACWHNRACSIRRWTKCCCRLFNSYNQRNDHICRTGFAIWS